MEKVAEIIEQEKSPYELERGKSIPTLIHGAIQFNLGFALKTAYPTQFRIASEVLLDTLPKGSTPDIVLYPAQPLDYRNDPSRRTDAPLLTIEIQSASQSTKEMTDKLESYFYFGVKSCWIVVPDFQAIFVYDTPFHYTFFHEKDILKDPTLGIEIDLKKVFE
ncbi:MAG: Uma2 family endonuclease [Spirosomataceae bacterium]